MVSKTLVNNILAKYNKHYSNLYARRTNGPRELVIRFDRLIGSNNAFIELVRACNKARGDIFSSDRECAAFMLALKDEGVSFRVGSDKMNRKQKSDWTDGLIPGYTGKLL